MDGVDGVAVIFHQAAAAGTAPTIEVLADGHAEFPAALREQLFALQASGADEIDREAQAANALAHCYAACCHQLLQRTGLAPTAIRAVGVHGQTIRHRPERGYTRQTNNPALLAELTGIDVIADFRSRDVAAGGQGAPLAPAFHAVVFGQQEGASVVCNIGGISNITVLREGSARGFDCGPGNALLDHWTLRHFGAPYDDAGRLAAQGVVDPELLGRLMSDSYFRQDPPKSTGRDLFNAAWLDACLASLAPDHQPLSAHDVLRTLTALTAEVIADDIARFAAECRAVLVCGGGAYNLTLMAALDTALALRGVRATLASTATRGVPPQRVEPLAFAWLAQRFVERLPGNLPETTGAAGPRILGALYPR